ncbi:GatB/YqeY domain-containing protein [Flavobacteriaceae bacterium]|nr:GatB/YqeY domain-containing protein [Flavobacteriaceae bacterium]
MTLIEKISEAIKASMKEKDTISLESLRAVKSALLLAQTQKGNSSGISADKEIKILQKLVKQRKESAEIYISQNRSELAEVEIKQSKIIERFLPKQLSPEEVEKIVSELINKTGASGMKDMGKIMGMASKQLSGVAGGKTISNIVRSKLS